MKRKDWMAKRAEAGLGTTATNRIAQAVQKKTGMETRVCIPGHMQRGGSPSAYDRDPQCARKLRAAERGPPHGRLSGLNPARKRER